MGAYSVAQAKAQLSSLLLAVESGEEVVITRRGIAVATLSPIAKPRAAVDWTRIKSFQKKSAKALINSKVDLSELVRKMRDE
jgi:prevent-host-death family protein